MQQVLAAVSLRDYRTEIRTFPFPDCTDDSGLLKVELCGVCGSDWPMYNTLPKSKGPLILGHEAVGFIQSLGRFARSRFGVKEGDRVALEEYLPCGYCLYCRTGDFRLCEQTDIFSNPSAIRFGATPVEIKPGLWGGYSQYQFLHPNSVFHRIPEKISGRLATLALPLGNGVEWAYLQGGLKIGECVVIQGPGQQGLSCVVAAKEAGAGNIIVTGLSNETDRRRLEIAKRLGAHHTIMVDQEDLLETTADLTGGDMADLVIDCASGGPETVVSAIQLARKCGRVILGGGKHKPVPEFDSDLLVRRFISVKGMRGHSYAAVELAISIIASNRYPLDEMCTHVFPLERTHDALASVGGKGIKNAIHVSVDPWQ